MTKTIDPIDHTHLAKVKKTWQASLEDAKKLPCETQEQEAYWAEWLNRAQKELTELEAEREQLNRPLLDGKARIDKFFKDARAPLEAFKALVSEKLAKAATARMLAQDAARQAALEAEDGQACAEALAAIPEDVRVEGTATSYTYEYKVVDAKLVPELFKVVDDSLVKAAIKAAAKQGIEPQIPGITFSKVAKVRSSGRKK